MPGTVKKFPPRVFGRRSFRFHLPGISRCPHGQFLIRNPIFRSKIREFGVQTSKFKKFKIRKNSQGLWPMRVRSWTHVRFSLYPYIPISIYPFYIPMSYIPISLLLPYIPISYIPFISLYPISPYPSIPQYPYIPFISLYPYIPLISLHPYIPFISYWPFSNSPFAIRYWPCSYSLFAICVMLYVMYYIM